MNDDTARATREATASAQACGPAMPDTHWSQVLRAGECNDPAALAALCRAYWVLDDGDRMEVIEPDRDPVGLALATAIEEAGAIVRRDGYA